MCFKEICFFFAESALFRSLWLRGRSGGVVSGSGMVRDRGRVAFRRHNVGDSTKRRVKL